MTDPDNLIEAVAKASKTWSFAKSPMLGGYRIVSGGEWKVFAGIEEASAALDRLNAKAAILAWLMAIRDDPGPLVIDAGESAASVGIGKCYDVEAMPRVWHAMIDALRTTLLASMKDGTHVG